MKQYAFPETKGWKLFLFLIVTGLLIFSRDTMLSMETLGFFRCQMLSVLLLAVLGVAFLAVNRKRVPEILRDDRMRLALLMAAMLLIPMLLKRDWQMMYISMLVYILAAVLFSYFITIRQLSRIYLLLLCGISLISLVCTYVLRGLTDQGILNPPSFVNGAGLPFYSFGLFHVAIEYISKRNFGIFREPGVYQFFLLLGLYLNHYEADWKKNWQLWTVTGILSITMLSTFATGGVIEMGLLVIFLFLDKKLYRNRGARILAVSAAAVLAAAVAWILTTKNSLYVDLVGMVEKFWMTPPEESRFVPIAMDFQHMLHHPLLGGRLAEVLEGVPNNTTSTMILLASLGAVFGSFHLIAWGVLCWNRQRNVFMNLFLFTILAMSFNTQNLIGNLFFWLFPVMALAQRGIPAGRAWRNARAAKTRSVGKGR